MIMTSPSIKAIAKIRLYIIVQPKSLSTPAVMGSAAVAVYLPLVLSFFTQKQFLGRRTTCHTQLFYRPDMAASGVSSAAVFSCDEPTTAPLAEVFPFFAELQTGAANGVFSHKVKIFSASRSAPSVWERTYYRIDPTSLLLETTEEPRNATVFFMVTEPHSDLHSPGGRFHLEFLRAEPLGAGASLSQCSNSTSDARRLKLCASPASAGGMNYCGPHNLVAAETCSRSGSRVITGLLTPFYRFPMKQCKRFDDLD